MENSQMEKELKFAINVYLGRVNGEHVPENHNYGDKIRRLDSI